MTNTTERTPIARGNTKSQYQLEQDLKRVTEERDRMVAAMMQIQRSDCPELEAVTFKFTYDARLLHAGVVEVAKVLLRDIAEADTQRRGDGER